MPRINPKIISHHLNVHLGACPVWQKNRHIAPERLKCLEKEVDKLQEAGLIREVQYLDWLVNVIMVKKASGK